MGASRTLLRKLDLDLIARIEASGRPDKPTQSLKTHAPRPGWTYRGARRNAVRETKAVMLRRGAEVKDRSYSGSIELNRSPKWSRCKSYSYAREIGPSAEPVR
jgi:hypothetical protein